MNRNYAERNLTLEFPIKDVKEKITKVIKAGVGTYVSPEINDMMGTYSFSMSRAGMFGCKMVITVNKIDEGNTSLSVNAKNLGHDNTSDSVLEQFITDFLKVLSEALSGKEITGELVSSNTRGCAGIILIFVIICFSFSSMMMQSCKKSNSTFCGICTSQCSVESLLSADRKTVILSDTFCGPYKYVETEEDGFISSHQGQPTSGTSIPGPSFSYCAPSDVAKEDTIIYYGDYGFTCN